MRLRCRYDLAVAAATRRGGHPVAFHGELRRGDVGQQYCGRVVERLGVGVRRPLAPRCKPDVLESVEVAVERAHIAARAEDAVYPVWGWFQGITVSVMRCIVVFCLFYGMINHT